MLGHFQRSADGRGTPLSYVSSTGNEIGLEVDRLHRSFMADRCRDQCAGGLTEQVLAASAEFLAPIGAAAPPRKAR